MYCIQCGELSDCEEICRSCQMQSLPSSSKKKKEVTSHQIRANARYVAKNIYPDESCSLCGYEHTEVCHIKAIKDFNDEDFVSDINDPKNLIRLCRNCHYELDTGKITL